MGWVEDLRGKTVGLDTAPLIYYIEDHPTFNDILLSSPLYLRLNLFPHRVEIKLSRRNSQFRQRGDEWVFDDKLLFSQLVYPIRL